MAQVPQAPLREEISLGALQSPFTVPLGLVDDRLLASLDQAAGFFEPILPQVSGGKRLRPLLVLMCAQGAGGALPPAATPVAASVELVHLASLMHDDVIDGAPERRGLPSAPAALGARRAVLAGDYLAAAAYQEIAAADLPEAGRLLSDAVVAMTLSEVTGTLTSGQLLSERQYLDLIGGKTAALFAAAAELGALVSEVGEERQADFRAFGQALGMAFQVRDDLLDLYGDAGRLGKGVHRDLAAGLYTLPVIYAAQAPGGKVIEERLARLRATTEGDGLVEEIAQLARELGGEERAHEAMRGYVEEARQALPECPARPLLLDLVEYAASRGE